MSQGKTKSQEEVLATIKGPSSAIREAIQQVALQGPFHSDIYLSIQDGRVDTLVGSAGNIVLSYCTFGSAFDDISVESEEREAIEAIIEVDEFLTHLSFSDDGDVQLNFRGIDSEDERLASVLEITGSLNSRLLLTDAETLLEEVPLSMPDQWTDDNIYVGEGENEPPVQITTHVDQIEQIIEVVEYDAEMDYYPITVEDDELYLDVSNEDAPDRNSVWGSLDAKSVESPEDFTTYYHEGFEELFNTLSGEVHIQTAHTGAPLVVVQESEGRVIRHLLGPVG